MYFNKCEHTVIDFVFFITHKNNILNNEETDWPLISMTKNGTFKGQIFKNNSYTLNIILH